MKVFLRAASLVPALLFFATGAFAQATRTWVSGVGDDVNPCSRTAPCKTFAGAISKTAAGGEIDALDPGGYGAVTITKSITIDGGSGIAGVLAAGVNGINVNGAGIVVTLRRIQINGAGTGLIGVNILQAQQVNIEETEIFGFMAGTGDGVYVDPASGTKVQIVHSRIENNLTAGVFIGSGSTTVVSCQLVGNGFAALDANGTAPLALVSTSNLAFNGRGIHTGGGARVRITENDIFANTTFAWEIGGGQIETHVDNRVHGTGSGQLTPVARQ